MRLLVTGGAGFIGSHFVDYVTARYPDDEVVVLDKLTYAGSKANLNDALNSGRVDLRIGDICDADLVRTVLNGCDCVVNFAAETHVDRSLDDASSFVRTNVGGVWTLLSVCMEQENRPRFVQISTDEVYGPKTSGESVESDPLSPGNPYSATKAGAEHLALAYHRSFGYPVLIIRGTNNFGPRQHREKFIPTVIWHALNNKPAPIYGDGQYVREWIYVEDFVRGVDLVLRRGTEGEIYNIGGGPESRLTQIQVVGVVASCLGEPRFLTRTVDDRPGHDRRYAVSSRRVRKLGWTPQIEFGEGIERTIDWYRKELSGG